ncbi:MAG: hypothetical protein AB7D28_10680 [Candidatus Berkiella sp.]
MPNNDCSPNSVQKINIFDAIKNKDIYGIMTYVNLGGDINIKNEQGATPLMYAIGEKWSTQEIKNFLDYVPNIDLSIEASCKKGYAKPIDMAIKKNDYDLVRVLLDYSETIIIGKEISEKYLFIDCSGKFKECIESIVPHINTENFSRLECDLIIYLYKGYGLHKSNNLDNVGWGLVDLLLSQPESIPIKYQQKLLHSTHLNFCEYLITNKYVEELAIYNEMCSLALQHGHGYSPGNKIKLFEFFYNKIEDKESVALFLNEHKNEIFEYSKFAAIVGHEYDKPGTVSYCSDATGIHILSDVKLSNNISEHNKIDTKLEKIMGNTDYSKETNDTLYIFENSLHADEFSIGLQPTQLDITDSINYMEKSADNAQKPIHASDVINVYSQPNIFINDNECAPFKTNIHCPHQNAHLLIEPKFQLEEMQGFEFILSL